jgi:hypothetical protein
MGGVRYREELQALQAANSWKGNQPMNEKPASGRSTSSKFQNAVYRLTFAGSFPKGAFDIENSHAFSREGHKHFRFVRSFLGLAPPSQG